MIVDFYHDNDGDKGWIWQESLLDINHEIHDRFGKVGIQSTCYEPNSLNIFGFEIFTFISSKNLTIKNQNQ